MLSSHTFAFSKMYTVYFTQQKEYQERIMLTTRVVWDSSGSTPNGLFLHVSSSGGDCNFTSLAALAPLSTTTTTTYIQVGVKRFQPLDWRKWLAVINLGVPQETSGLMLRLLPNENKLVLVCLQWSSGDIGGTKPRCSWTCKYTRSGWEPLPRIRP